MSDFETLVTIAIGVVIGFWFIATTCFFAGNNGVRFEVMGLSANKY